MPDLIAIEAEPAESIGIAQRAGFDGLDIRFNRFTDAVIGFGVDRFRDEMSAAGLRPGYCSLTAQKIGVDAYEWAREIADLPRRAGVARELGYERATSVVLPFSDELDFAANMAMHVERIRQAADILADFGIAFGVEYVSPKSRREGKKHEFVHDLRGALELLDEVDRPNAGLMLDCFHWACAGESESQIAELDPSIIVAVHLNDFVQGRSINEQTVMERLLPGESGLIDIEAFLRGLVRCGYAGPLTAEPTHPRWKDVPADRAAKQTADSILSCLARFRGGATATSERESHP
ncbi:MAG: sugar phosphate isomerase/epimerase [Phycisphaerales bacterium]|nr:sugar phosphate isomerase/epimerase [Phycisphaerales bacterium]MCB9837134.1 sugar phosphate isomerase/epimerase [Phycisphaera sp.]